MVQEVRDSSVRQHTSSIDATGETRKEYGGQTKMFENMICYTCGEKGHGKWKKRHCPKSEQFEGKIIMEKL